MSSPSQIVTCLFAVMKREFHVLLQRPLYTMATVVIIVVSCIFFFLLLSEGTPAKMPIAVIDNDHSSISRRLVHELEATEALTVSMVTNDFREARLAMQQGKIYAILDVPEHFYDDLGAFKQPQLTYYINNAYSIAGSTSYKQLFAMMNYACGAFQREILRKRGLPDDRIMLRLQPIVVDMHFIGNPSSNYAVYLLSVILPGILGLIILMTTIYSIGYELKKKTSRQWLATANNNYTIAMFGKLFPHYVIYSILGVTLNVIMFKLMEFPVHGSFLWLNVGMLVYILALQSVAVCFIGLIPVLRDAISIGALYGMLSFSLSGFTFPFMGMLSWVKSLAHLFPLRFYYLIYVNEALLGNSIMQSAPYIGCLFLFYLLHFFVWRRLYKAMYLQNYSEHR